MFAEVCGGRGDNVMVPLFESLWFWYNMRVKENDMSRLSFKSFCIEFYARHIGSTGADVYRMFSESGLLKTLDDDYEDLHGLGWEALMPMFDEYLGRSAR